MKPGQPNVGIKVNAEAIGLGIQAREKDDKISYGTARKHSRYGHRDATMILLAYRHGLRASELCDLQWHQVEISAGRPRGGTGRSIGGPSLWGRATVRAPARSRAAGAA
jgi:integrase